MKNRSFVVKIFRKPLPMAMVLVVAISLAGCAAWEQLFGNEEKVTLDRIPAAVKTAAEREVPGLLISKAEVETKDRASVYELEGTADGLTCELRLRADGTVLRIRKDSGEE